MKYEELAAYIGAAAWLPQIATWLYRRFVLPSVRLIPNQYAEVGFNSLGPIFNFRIAFSVENKDIVVDGMDLTLRHEDGDSHVLRWAGLAERLSQITDASGNRQLVERDDSPIAIKVGTQTLLERFVRFQEPHFHEVDRPLIRALVAHFHFLKQTKPNNYAIECVTAKELKALYLSRKNAFWWRAGQYDAEVLLTSPQKFRLANAKFSFELTANDIDLLRGNLSIAEMQVENAISSDLPDFKARPINWNWIDVEVRRDPD